MKCTKNIIFKQINLFKCQPKLKNGYARCDLNLLLTAKWSSKKFGAANLELHNFKDWKVTIVCITNQVSHIKVCITYVT